MIKDLIQDKKAVVVLDTNVLIHLYYYSPDYSNFALNCLNQIYDAIMIPSTVALEYEMRQNKEYRNIKRNIQRVDDSIKQQIVTAKNSMMNTCDDLEKLKFPDIDELRNIIDKYHLQLKKWTNDFFEERKGTIEFLAATWDEKDPVKSLFDNLKATQHIMHELERGILYQMSDEANKRFNAKPEPIPPGFKDKGKNCGIRKYDDYFIWKEIMIFAKKNHTDVIFVTDDLKCDWWETSKKGMVFHHKLIEEFKKTKQSIKAYTSVELFKEISKDYDIEQSDAIKYALQLTDEEYCNRIETIVFDSISDDLIYSSEYYIDVFSSNIGDEGLSDLEITNVQYIGWEQTNIEDNGVCYSLKYNVTLEGYSYEYLGKDDDTREVILSPANNHVFEGEVVVAIYREINFLVDFESDTEFSGAEIVDAQFEETIFKSWSEVETDGMSLCPDCGEYFNEREDGGNGFCIRCADKH